jgi:hypothetical protein
MADNKTFAGRNIVLASIVSANAGRRMPSNWLKNNRGMEKSGQIKAAVAVGTIPFGSARR